MRFKKPKPVHRARSLQKPEFPLLKDCAELSPTPLLNMALEVIARDPTLTLEQRLNAGLIRSSWGNWYPYAIKNMLNSAPPVNQEVLKYFFHGNGPCPYCGEAATQPFDVLRWHRACIAQAYARDAVLLGNEEQRKWAADVIVERRPS